jgi:hypothetical protein
LYAGGAFTNLGSASGDYVSRYDLSRNGWYAVGSGFNGPVYALDYDGDTLYAGGDFTISGFTLLSRVAQFSGGHWSGFGSGADGSVQAVSTDGRHLYIGGNFLTAGGKPSTYFGRWRLGYDVFLPLVMR